jgi:ATP diphosphatase
MTERANETPVGVLQKALAIQHEASLIGLDWANASGVLKKLREELDELEEAVRSGTKHSCSEEVGDLIFSVVNLARMLGVDPEDALRDGMIKFERRFRDVLASVKRSGRDVGNIPLKELDLLWEATKRAESPARRRRSV